MEHKLKDLKINACGITDTELVHRFMGCDWTTERFSWRIGSTVPMTIEHLDHYKTSWNWLMPVIEKIKGLEKDYPIATDNVLSLRICEPIETVFNEVVNFIKWYNDQVVNF